MPLPRRCSSYARCSTSRAPEAPIGISDSGIGGLTVLDAILKADAFHNDNLKPGGDGVRDFDVHRSHPFSGTGS